MPRAGRSMMENKHILNEQIDILHGDCREVLKTFADGSFDAIVTDPPYELGFMGKKWDSSGIAYDRVVWAQALRVLKPGGHLLSFGGSRTYHRMACAIEDAGFEIRDMIEWIYGSGFPKSLDVSKAMDKAMGAKRERNVVPEKRSTLHGDRPWMNDPNHRFESKEAISKEAISKEAISKEAISKEAISKEAISKEAKQWAGWGTALKPAHEPICVARKPLVGTVVQNVRLHGTGAINIDGSRIGSERIKTCGEKKGESFTSVGTRAGFNGVDASEHNGRWPANLILDSEAAEALDAQSSHLQSGKPCGSKRAKNQIFGKYENKDFPLTGFGDSGGASRFFYTAKASGSDRGNQVKGALPLFGVEEEEWRNSHPTVKPLALLWIGFKKIPLNFPRRSGRRNRSS